MDGLLVDLRDNVSITVYFDCTYSGLHGCIMFFLLIVSLLHYLAIQPSRLQVCCNKISCQLSGNKCCNCITTVVIIGSFIDTRHIFHYTLYLKNVPPLTCCNLDIHDPITINFGRSGTKKVGNQTTLCFPTSPM